MYGLNIDPNNTKGNPDPAELRELGVEMVRYTFYDSTAGGRIDPDKAEFYTEKAGAYREAGIDSLVILTYDTYPDRPAPEAPDPDWDNYLNRFVERAGQIARQLALFRPAFQIWNEPDHPVHPGYAPTLREAVFGRMLRRTHDAIKAVDPDLLVVTGGLAAGNPSWLVRVTQSLGGALPADVVAFHPYGQRPDRDWPYPNWAFGYVGDLLNNYYRVSQNKPMWITEIGVKEEDLDHNRDQVAEFLHRYCRTITSRYRDKVKQLFWFCYSDGMVPPYGLLDGAGNRKPAYYAFLKATARRPEEPEPAVAPPPPPSGVPVPPADELPVTPQPPDVSAGPPEEVTEVSPQITALQQQMAQIQGHIQQLFDQQARFEQQLQQLSAQPGTPVALPPVSPDRPAPPSIQNITNQLKRDPGQQFPTRPLRQIRRVIIHHTAIPPHIGAERIAEYRVDKQGWPGIGYHYFITGDGLIQQTNELTTVSTHAGDYNPISIGVCFAGDFTDTAPTLSQIEAGARLIAWLLARFGLSLQAVSGYKELVNTQSPGLQWDAGLRWGEQLKMKIQTY